MDGSKKKRQEKVGHTEEFQVKKKKWARRTEEIFYPSEEKVTGKDFSDNNIYCGTVALLEGILTHIYHMYLNRYR